MGLRAPRALTGFTGPAYGTLRATGSTGARALRAAYGTTGPTGPEGPYSNLNHDPFPRQQLVTPSTFVAAVEQNEDFTWYKLDDPKSTESCKTYDHLVTLLAVFSFLYSKYLYQFGYTWCEPVNS